MGLNLKGVPNKISKGSDEGIGERQKIELDITIHGTDFVSDDPINKAVVNSVVGGIESNGPNFVGIGGINLPHGATITSAVVNGTSLAGMTWSFKRFNLSSQAVETIASGSENVVSSTITSKFRLVDNINFTYVFETSAIADSIFGARVTYTK